MAILVLVVWLATVAVGITLLRAGGAARRLAATQSGLPSQLEPVREVASAAAPAAVPAAAMPARIGAIPLTADGKPPPVPHARVVTPPGEHPVLEFAHPALAVSGLAVWTMFTFVHYRPMAWIAVGILLGAILVGLGWLLRNRQAGRRRGPAALRFPPKLASLHGLAATLTILLAVLSALTASRG